MLPVSQGVGATRFSGAIRHLASAMLSDRIELKKILGFQQIYALFYLQADIFSHDRSIAEK
jgi:hypothetical protein